MDERLFPGHDRAVQKDEAVNLISKMDYRRLICLTGEMNAGKTHTIIEAIEKNDKCSVALFVVGRVSLAAEIEKRATSAFDVYNYSKSDKINEGILKVKTGMCEVKAVFIICINSLTDKKLPVDGLPFDMVIIDEATMTMKNLMSSIIDRSMADSILTYLTEVVFARAEVVVLIDAALPEPLKVDMKAMMATSGEDFRTHNLKLYREGVDPIFSKAIYYSSAWEEVENVPGESLASIMKEILQAVYVKREKISISMPFKDMAHVLAAKILAARPDTDPYVPHIVVQTAEERSERENRVSMGYTRETLDFHELCRESQVTIINPCVSVGVSLDTKYNQKHFAFFCFGPYTCSIDEQIQMTARFRHVESKTLHYCVFKPTPNAFCNYKDLPALHNFYTGMRDWSNEISSSQFLAMDNIKRALQRAYPGLELRRGLHKRIRARKSKEAINCRVGMDANECDKVYQLTDCPMKWSLIAGKNKRRAVYTREIPKYVLDKNQIKYKKTNNGEYYLVCS